MVAGAPLSAFNLMVLTLAAALPSASNVSLLAERHGADTGRVARIIMSSTVLAFASLGAMPVGEFKARLDIDELPDERLDRHVQRTDHGRVQ